jgi:tetratricopeptide (TPR) repeat protein
MPAQIDEVMNDFLSLLEAKELNMAVSTSMFPEQHTALPRRMLIVEAGSGAPRRRWLEKRLETLAASGARTFIVSCDFDSGGPWAGVNELFAELYPEIRAQRPDLVERHALELVYAVPRLRKTLAVRNPNLTDLAPAEEKTRNYAADRAFRNIHGLIDLLATWKTAISPKTPWFIACDSYDTAGTMSSSFFKELMRRRGAQLNLHLIAAVGPGRGEATGETLGAATSSALITLDLPHEPAIQPAPVVAARLADELNRSIGDDRMERQASLPALINLWHAAGAPERYVRSRYFGLDVFNTLGLYSDALRYGDGLLELAVRHIPGDESLHWAIIVKMMACYSGLQDAESGLKFAAGDCLKFLEQGHPLWYGQLCYMIAMLYARYQKPRDLTKGEEYLDRGLAQINQANLPEDELYFQTSFNRNGVAIIRNFQGRHHDAIDLCERGLDHLDHHLGAEKHRLHRSVLVYNIAQVHAATGNYDEAIRCYASAMEMDPNYSEYYNERGSIFLRLDRLEEALADYLHFLELTPPCFEGFTNLGQCYRRMRAPGKAVDAYSKALDLQPNQLLALLGRAKAYEELGSREPAIADYTAALALDPTLWEAIASRGVMYYEAGDLPLALADFDRAIQLAPGQADLYQNRAIVHADLCRHRQAASDLEAAIRYGLGEADSLELRTRLASSLPAEAAQEMAKALTA